jgi:flagellar basal-body rod protein FlgF
LQRPLRRELFAGWPAQSGFFCPVFANAFRRKPLFNLNFPCWHSFCTIPLARSLGEPRAHVRETPLRRRLASRGEYPMENALLVGLSRQMAISREMDVVANNIANIDTDGYKADNAMFGEFLMSNARDKQFTAKDQVISFVQDKSTWIDLAPGAIQHTGNPFDIAIDGKAYFAVQTPRGLRYTRNGSFSIDATGNLVTTEGYQVQGTGGPITFQNTDHNVTIAENGTITVREGNSTADSPRGQIQIVGFDQPRALQKDGASTFTAPPTAGLGPAPQGAHIVQGAIEKSNVRGVYEMTRMIEITRSYSDIANVLQQQNDQRKNALQQLSEIPT